METILKKARIILRNMYVALGATAMPFLIHAMYGMRQPDPSTYTVPVQGRVVSEETGEPVAGISIRYGRYILAETDSDGRFLIYLPDGDSSYVGDSYVIEVSDRDGFETGGFFSNKYVGIALDKTADPLEVSLYRESQVAVIRGTVLSKGTGEPVPGVRVSVYSADGGADRYGNTLFLYGFQALSDNDGQFYIQVPERDSYFIYFSDANDLFQRKEMRVTADEIKHSLKVDLEQRTGKDGR